MAVPAKTIFIIFPRLKSVPAVSVHSLNLNAFLTENLPGASSA